MDMPSEMRTKTADEKIAILAKAILELASKAAHADDFNGETTVSNGVYLQLERVLDALVSVYPPT